MADFKKLNVYILKRMKEGRICELLKERFGMEVNKDDYTKDQLVELYMNAQEEYFQDAKADVDVQEKPKMVMINIAKEKDEPLYVDVGLNGKAYRIRRGVNVEVPVEVLNILKDCVQTFFEYDEEGNVTTNDQPRFNIQVVG